MAFAHWDPLRDLLAIQQRLDRFSSPGTTAWMPPVDLFETDDQYVIMAELPGVRREDIDIRVQDGLLVLSGTRREPGRLCEQYHRVERGYGSFNRTFQLPLAIEADRIVADLRDGVLTVACPKSVEAARRIQIT